MPPLMGAGAFVMVELTGIPYTEIMSAALLPAILFFLTVWIGINAFASRMDLKGIDEADRPSTRTVWITALFFLVPFSVLLERMFFGRYTPQFAACVAILAAFLLLLLNANMEISIKRAFQRMQMVCVTAGKQKGQCDHSNQGKLQPQRLNNNIHKVFLPAARDPAWQSPNHSRKAPLNQ